MHCVVDSAAPVFRLYHHVLRTRTNLFWDGLLSKAPGASLTASAVIAEKQDRGDIR